LISARDLIETAKYVPVTTGRRDWTDGSSIRSFASAVDFIAAHILPTGEDLFTKTRRRQDHIRVHTKLRARGSGKKRIVMQSSAAQRRRLHMRDADPGRSRRRALLREFVPVPRPYGIRLQYHRSLDQPWKTQRRRPSAVWGLFRPPRRKRQVRLDRPVRDLLMG